MPELAGLAGRVSAMYGLALVLMRLSGKRSLESLNVIDFVVILVIGDVFDDVFWADIPVAQGLVGLTTILMLHVALAWLTARRPALQRVFEGEARQIIAQGRCLPEALARERLRPEEVAMELRLQGEADLAHAAEGCLETAGHFSWRPTEAERPARRDDPEARALRGEP